MSLDYENIKSTSELRTAIKHTGQASIRYGNDTIDILDGAMYAEIDYDRDDVEEQSNNIDAFLYRLNEQPIQFGNWRAVMSHIYNVKLKNNGIIPVIQYDISDTWDDTQAESLAKTSLNR